jgi:hypothetical protein
MKGKTILTALLLLSGSYSYAGFTCQDAAGLVSVTAEHENFNTVFEGFAGKVIIALPGQNQIHIHMTAQVLQHITRVGSRYSYELPVGGISFSVYESLQLTHEIGCNPKGRATCDYNWGSSYAGHLNLNGKSYELDCQIL